MQNQRNASTFEHVIRLIAVIGPLTGLPQAVNVWIYGEVVGVSVVSWLLFMVFSCLWLAHAIRRQDRALAVSNLLWIVVDVIIILGVMFAKNFTDSGLQALLSRTLLKYFLFS